MYRAPWGCLALLLAALAPVPAQDDPVSDRRPKVALVLGGGGARGLAHIGVLEVLEQHRVPIDFVVGTSMGALIGGLYACGWSPEELRELVETTDWSRVLGDTPERGDLAFRRKQDENEYLMKVEFGWKDGWLTLPPGLLQGQNAKQLLDRVTLRAWRTRDFDELPIPFRCVAADLADGSKVVLGSGRLSDALRASMSIPGVFAPAVIDDRHLVDGGIVENLPVSIAKSHGAEVVIAIDVGTPLDSIENVSSLFGVTNQVVGIMMQQNVTESKRLLDADDLLLTVPLEGVTTMDFEAHESAISQGREAAASLADKLRSLAVDQATWQTWVEHQRQRFVPPIVDRVVVENQSGLADEVVRHPISQGAGRPLDVDQLDRDIGDLTGLGTFQSVAYELRSAGQGEAADAETTELAIEAIERDWGPHYFRFGVGLAGDFRGDNDFNIAIRHTWVPANGLGGEWRNDLRVGSRNLLRSEFYQPLEPSMSWFVVPAIELQQRVFTLIQDGRDLLEADAYWAEGSFAFGRVLGNWGELRVGYHRLEGSAKPNFGILGEGPREALQDGWVEAGFTIDTLDNLAFPRHGFRSVATLRYGNEDLGAPGEYTIAELAAALPVTFGDTTFLTRLFLGSNLDEGPTALPPFALGGFLDLSGFRPEELLGNHAALGALIVYHRLSRPTTKYSSAIYVGGSAELGATWFDSDEIAARDLIPAGSVFFGIDTVLGPIYGAFGFAENDNYSAYLYIGQPY